MTKWAGSEAGEARRAALLPTSVCDHATCTRKRCKCSCHKRPIQPIQRRDPTPYDIRSLIIRVDSAARMLDAVKARIPEAIVRANNDTDDGHKPASTGPVVTGGGSDPDLFNRAFTKDGHPKHDPIRACYDALVTNVTQAETCAAKAYNAAKALQGVTPEEAQKILDALDTASCMICSRVVANKGTDWLRKGRCAACNAYLDRTGNERPKSLWPEAVDGGPPV